MNVEAPPESSPPIPPAIAADPWRGRATQFVFRHAIYFVLLALVVFIALVDSNFVSVINLRNILLANSTKAIIALGAGLVLISGGVDLSAGRMVGMAAVASASMLQTAEYSRRFFPDLPQLWLVIPIAVAIALAAAFGAVNGFIVAVLRVPPFIATLGMMVVIYGLTSIYYDRDPNNSQPIAGLRSSFTTLGSGSIGTGEWSLPYIVVLAAGTAVAFWVLLNMTTFGKSVYAIGGNPDAARVSGIRISLVLIAVYSIAGAAYGFGGVLEAARTGGATSNYGTLYELDAIAAAVVGGVSTKGGVGKVGGILAGVLVFGVINYGLTFIGVNPFFQQIIKGVIIIAAVAFDTAGISGSGIVRGGRRTVRPTQPAV